MEVYNQESLIEVTILQLVWIVSGLVFSYFKKVSQSLGSVCMCVIWLTYLSGGPGTL